MAADWGAAGPAGAQPVAAGAVTSLDRPAPAAPRRSAGAGRRLRAALAPAVAGIGLAALLAPSTPLPLPLDVRWLAAFLLFVGLPGWLLVRALLPTLAIRRLDTPLVALAAGYGVAVLLGLALHVLCRPIAPWQVAAGGGLVVVALALTAAWRTAGPPATGQPAARPAVEPPATDRRRAPGPAVRRWLAARWPVLLVLVVAAPLRLADLGWSEFQGDEARVVLRAMAALQGADGALAAHRKVPGEILLAYLFAGSLGQIVEGVARLPYALAAVGAVLAFYSLARKLLGGPAALAAGLLLAVNGYFVAFGRILQYDSLSFFLGIAGLLCCWQFGRAGRPASAKAGPDSGGAPRGNLAAGPAPAADADVVAWAALGALLLAGAALVALGAIFLVAPALLLAWPGLRRYGRSWRVLAAWGWPVLPAAAAAALVLGEGRDGGSAGAGPTGVWSYLGPRFGSGAPYWNGADLLQSANHYLSSPYLLVMLLGGAFALVLALACAALAAERRDAMIRLAVALAFAALSWGNPRLAPALGALLAVVLAVQAPARYLAVHVGPPLGMRVAMLWAAGPLLMHLFLIRVPGTHFREAFPGLILLVVGLAAPFLARRPARLALGALLAALVVGSWHYAWVTLVQRTPEYQITYPADRHPLDWSGRDGRGIGGVFGAVHRHGWKALGVLYADGTLTGGFATNESPAIAAWYIRQPQGCEGAIDLAFRVPKTPQDRNLAVPVPPPAAYQTRGQVRVNGRVTVAIQRPPSVAARIGDIPADAYAERFDRELASAWRPVGELYRADLGAAAARRRCPPRDQAGVDSLRVLDRRAELYRSRYNGVSRS